MKKISLILLLALIASPIYSYSKVQKKASNPRLGQQPEASSESKINFAFDYHSRSHSLESAKDASLTTSSQKKYLRKVASSSSSGGNLDSLRTPSPNNPAFPMSYQLLFQTFP